MVLFPRRGSLYWHVTDFWESFVAVPVMVEYTKGLVLSLRFRVSLAALDSGEYADYEYTISRFALHKTQRQAQAVAARLNMRAAA